MTDQNPGHSKGETSGLKYNTASTGRRCLYAALSTTLVVLVLFGLEMCFVPIWTDSRGDYYSGMIGVIIALAGVSITGYIFLTEHLASSAIRDSAFDVTKEFKADVAKSMRYLLFSGLLILVMISLFAFLKIEDTEYGILSAERLSPVIIIPFAAVSAAFIQFDYDLVTVDTRMHRSAIRREKDLREAVKKLLPDDYTDTSIDAKRHDCFKKFFEVESIVLRMTGTPENEQMLGDHILNYQTKMLDDNPRDNIEFKLIRDYFDVRRYRDCLALLYKDKINESGQEKITRREGICQTRKGAGNSDGHSNQGASLGEVDQEGNELLLRGVSYLRREMAPLYRNKTLKGLVLNDFSFADANLEHTSLDSSILKGCNFSSVKGVGIKLSNSDIDGIITNSDTVFNSGVFHESHITKPRFDGLSMEGADFRSCLILEPNMVNAKAAKSDYSKVKIIGGNISKSDMSNSYMDKTAMIGVEIRDCKMITCHLSGCTMNRLESTDVDLTHAVIVETEITSSILKEMKFVNVRIENVSMNQSKIVDAFVDSSFWMDSKLISSSFKSDKQRLILRRVHFSRTEFVNVLFEDVDMRGSFFENAVFMDCMFKGTDFGDSVFKNCEFHHSILDEYCIYNDARFIGCNCSGDGLPARVRRQIDAGHARGEIHTAYQDIRSQRCFRSLCTQDKQNLEHREIPHPRFNRDAVLRKKDSCRCLEELVP